MTEDCTEDSCWELQSKRAITYVVHQAVAAIPLPWCLGSPARLPVRPREWSRCAAVAAVVPALSPRLARLTLDSTRCDAVQCGAMACSVFPSIQPAAACVFSCLVRASPATPRPAVSLPQQCCTATTTTKALASPARNHSYFSPWRSRKIVDGKVSKWPEERSGPAASLGSAPGPTEPHPPRHPETTAQAIAPHPGQRRSVSGIISSVKVAPRWYRGVRNV